MSNKNIKIILLIVFGLSGVAALMYEIIWARMLGLVFGNTVYAISTVLAVFFAGLALGSLLFGKLVDRQRKPLLLLALLELGIGVYALLTPWIFDLVQQFQINLASGTSLEFSEWSLLRFGLSFLALIIPSILIGGTLPVIIKYFTKSIDQIGSITAKLYSANAFGATVGVILAGFVLIFFLGMQGTLFAAAAINIIIGLVILILMFTTEKEAGEVPDLAQSKTAAPGVVVLDRRRKIILVAFFLTGFAALALEVLWTRVLIMAIGTTVYSFSIILASFILGLALGSFAIARFVDRINTLKWFAGILFVLGLTVIFTTAALDSLPLLFFSLVKTFDPSSFFAVQIIGLSITFLVMLVPTMLMGAIFPLAVKLYAEKIENIGTCIGKLYSVNTLGGIAGSVAGGFLFLPWFGIQKSILIAASVYIALGIFFSFMLPQKNLARALAFSGTLVIGLTFMLSPWQSLILSSGIYRNIEYPEAVTRKSMREGLLQQNMVFYEEGVSATVAVLETGNVRHLRINGKTDASTASDDMPTQLLLGHLPMMLHENPKSALVIGLGSGITLGAIEQYPAEIIDAVEIEPAVAKAAEYFSDFNNNALQDPRLTLTIADARNFLKRTDKTYDVISSEPSNFWIEGNYNLFTKEFYEAVRGRLNERGIFMQWIHAYETDTESLKIAIRTLQSVFPYVSAWSPVTSYVDLLLVATEEPQRFNVKMIDKKFTDQKIAADLARADIQNVEDFLPRLYLGDSQLEKFGSGAKLHTDDRPILGIKSPLSLYNIYATAENVSALSVFRDGTNSKMFIFDNKEQEDVFKQRNIARNYFAEGLLFMDEGKVEEASKKYEKALELYPNHAPIEGALRLNYVFLIEIYKRTGDVIRSEHYFNKLKEMQ